MLRLSRWVHLKLRNFGCYRNLDLPIPESGLVLLTGSNTADPGTKSNASGKSTIFEALLYALTGKIYKYGAKVVTDEVVSWGADSASAGTLVAATFVATSGESVSIVRTFNKKASGVYILVDGAEVRGASKADTQRMITDMVGLDFEGLTAVVLRPQGALEDFASMTDAGRKGVLERILRLSIFAKARSQAIEALRAAERLEADQRSVVASLGAQVEAQRRLEEQGYADYVERRKVLDDYADSIAGRYADIEEAIGHNIEKYEGLIMEMQSAERELESRESADALVQKLLLEKSKCESLLGYATSQAEARANDLRKVANMHLEHTVCPVCWRDVDAKCRKHFLKERKLRISEHKQRLKTASAEVSELSAKLQQFRADLAVATEEQKAFNDTHWQLVVIKGECARLVKEIKAARVSLKETSVKLRNILSEANEPYKSLASSSSGALVEDYSKAQDAHASLLNMCKHLKFWCSTGFGQGGVKSYVMRSVAAEITDLINDYYSMLSFAPIHIRLSPVKSTKASGERDSMTLIITTPEREVDYRSYSGGEKRKVTIAVLLALVEFGLRYSATSLRLAFFDEVFDGLDAASIETVMAALKVLQQRVGLVLVISNNDTLVDLATDVWVAVKGPDGVANVQR